MLQNACSENWPVQAGLSVEDRRVNSDPLAQLRDIHLPPWPTVWPPAPGWWVLALLVVCLVALLLRIAIRYYRRHRRQRAIIAALYVARDNYAIQDAPRFAAEVSMLLRRVALNRFPRQQVAGLNGADWLAFLDRTGGEGRFRQGPGRVLAEGPYALQVNLEADALTLLAQDWLQKNT
ncbi:MAG: DUF4381 domain-containing protein [Candidatus Competibacteraceae bacterium]|nr:DUF4381 domain-containing protein [Candidatus Competibacteraceae bacterium]